MHLDIITPDQKVFQGEAKSVQFPGSEGSFEVLNNHAPMIASLKKGSIKVTGENGEVQLFEVRSGLVEVLFNQVTVLAEQAPK
jgi:F-type H+-transporting ATPase subunit epsilon